MCAAENLRPYGKAAAAPQGEQALFTFLSRLKGLPEVFACLS
jgi:hypothetical protein